MSALVRIDSIEVAALGAIVALAVVGYNQPEVAPATGVIGGALGGWLKHSITGFCVFKSADRCMRERVAAIASGAFIGAGVGVVRRGYRRAQ